MTSATLAQAWPGFTPSALVEHALGPAYDQGQRPTCLAFAFTHAHESERADRSKLSSEYLLWASRQRDGLAADAQFSTLSATRRALDDHGQPVDQEWPYDATRAVGPGYAPPAGSGTLFTMSSVAAAITVSGLCKELSKGKTPVIVIEVVEPEFQAPSGGIVSTGTTASTIAKWLHALTVVGWGTNEAGEVMVVVRNSWGPDWGVSGYGLVGEAYLVDHLRHVVVLTQ